MCSENGKISYLALAVQDPVANYLDHTEIDYKCGFSAMYHTFCAIYHSEMSSLVGSGAIDRTHGAMYRT
jgi:hypothetical protein